MKKNGSPEVPPGEFLENSYSAENGHVAVTLEKFSRARERDNIFKRNRGGKVTQKQVKESLLEQLRLQNKTSEFYGDLVNDYVKYWSLKNKLITDINKKGLRYKTVNGNGIEVEKPNESVTNLPKITTAMLKILNDLNLKEPLSESSAEDDYL